MASSTFSSVARAAKQRLGVEAERRGTEMNLPRTAGTTADMVVASMVRSSSKGFQAGAEGSALNVGCRLPLEVSFIVASCLERHKVGLWWVGALLDYYPPCLVVGGPRALPSTAREA